MPKETTHHMRPGPIRGSQVLCELDVPIGNGHYTAELTDRGLEQVNCRDCLFIIRELLRLWHDNVPSRVKVDDRVMSASLKIDTDPESTESELQSWWRLFCESRRERVGNCEDITAAELEHHAWDTKQGNFRTCSWCGVLHPHDDYDLGINAFPSNEQAR